MISSHYSFFSSWKREFYIFLHICGGLANDTQSMCRRSWSGDIYVALINVSRNKTKHNLITFKAETQKSYAKVMPSGRPILIKLQ